jgi:transposase
MADLPCVGQPVTLLLTVRKFFCPNPACPRKIFAEQFPDLVPSYARITNRLRKGAAQAQQVADKFHLLLNLREKLKELMARQQKLLPHVEISPSDAIADKARGTFSFSRVFSTEGAEVFSEHVCTPASRFL